MSQTTTLPVVHNYNSLGTGKHIDYNRTLDFRKYAAHNANYRPNDNRKAARIRFDFDCVEMNLGHRIDMFL